MKKILRIFVKVRTVCGNCPEAENLLHQPHMSWYMADPRSVYWTRSLFLVMTVDLGLFVWLPLGLLWVAGAALGLTQRADRSVAMDLLVAGQASLGGGDSGCI